MPKPHGQFEPVHSAHAIDQVVFAIRFQNELSTEILVELDHLFANSEQLPVRKELLNMSFQFSPGSGNAADMMTPASQVPLTAGYTYMRNRPDGTLETELRIEKTTIIFRTTTYERWATTWREALVCFERALPFYARASRLIAVSLTYVDKFVWTGDGEPSSPAVILRRDSVYLTPRVLDAPDLWHSHSGTFERADAKTKKLISVNVDYLEETKAKTEKRRVVVVKTSLTDMLNHPGYEPLELSAEGCAAAISDRMVELHSRDKEILGNIWAPGMARRIALID